MEGALLRHGPSVISSLRVEGWFCLHRTVRDSGLSVEGSTLDTEPSTIWGINVEGSVLENGTVRGFGLQRGWFRSGRWTFHDAGHFRGRLGPEEWNLPRFRTSARRVPLWMLNLP